MTCQRSPGSEWQSHPVLPQSLAPKQGWQWPRLSPGVRGHKALHFSWKSFRCKYQSVLLIVV